MARLSKLFLPGRYKKSYVPMADGLRVLCVMIVAWYHIWQQSWLNPVLTVGPVSLDFNTPVRTGYMMVDLLLLLSGFLLFLPYARAREDRTPCPGVRDYFLKRALRILPSYYLCLAVVFFGFALPRGEYACARDMLIDLIGHLTFTHNLAYQSYLGTKLNGVLWTLAVEVQFYAIAPLLGRTFVKRPALTYLLMTAVGWLYRFGFAARLSDSALYFNQLPAMLDVYANGMAAAWAFVWLQKHIRPRWFTALPATLLCLGALAGIWLLMAGQSHEPGIQNVRLGQMLRRFPLSAMGALLLASGGQAMSWLQWLLSNRLIRFFSAISYNLYIWHQFVAVRLKEWHIPAYVSAMPQQAGEQPWQTRYTLLCFGAAIALAALLTYGFEKPVSRLRRRA